jgi:transposase
VYTSHQNLIRYGGAVKPQFASAGRPRRLSKADERAVLEWILGEGWRDQDEIVKWLDIEHGVEVSQSTVSRMIKRNG